MDVYIKNRNKLILSFLNGISYGEQEMKKQLTLKTCVALEHLYGMSTKYFVVLMCFVNNIMQCQATESPMCIILMLKLDQQEATKQFLTGWFHKVPRNLIFLKVIAWLHLIMIRLLANSGV